MKEKSSLSIVFSVIWLAIILMFALEVSIILTIFIFHNKLIWPNPYWDRFIFYTLFLSTIIHLIYFTWEILHEKYKKNKYQEVS
jgi:hypothetical protein